MFKLFKATFGIIVTLLVLIACYLSFIIFIATKSHPIVTGEVFAPGARDSIEIYRNQYGIPHVVAASDRDAFFGIGYAHAQDRLWQMDIARRAADGRLSEIFGRKTLAIDMFFRALGISAISDNLYDHINDDSRMALDAYAAGVNAYIHANVTALPFEFDALDYQPDDWTGADCLKTARMMSWELNLSFWSDIAFAELAEHLGVQKARELTPNEAPAGPTVTQSGFNASVSYTPNTRDDNPAALFPTPVLYSVFQAAREYRTLAGNRGTAVGSNCWAIPKRKDGNASAILANDPHLALLAPPRWYQAHITSPTLNAVGLTIPGMPFIISGRNDHISWGVTNMMVDDFDFFIEKIDPENPKHYILPNGESRPFQLVRETIKVKDSTDAILDFRHTERSAVLSDVHLFLDPKFINLTEQDTTGDYLRRYCLTFAWTGAAESDETLAMYRLNKAKNWKRFVRAVNGFTSPGLNFVYADALGNVGVAPAAAIPRRQKGDGNFPRPGWEKAYAWKGLRPPSDLPRDYNPKRGFVVAANNVTARPMPFFITSLWEPASRAERIHALLEQYEEYSVAEAGIMQVDIGSPHAAALTPILLADIEDIRATLDSAQLRALDALATWDYTMEATLPAPALFSVWLERLTYNTFIDEMGERLYRRYTFVTSVPTRKIFELARFPYSTWFNDVTTPPLESRSDIVRRSFLQAFDSLATRFETPDINAWQYGEIHRLTIPHILGEQNPLDMLVNLGPYNVGGSNTTINNMEWHYRDPFDAVVGASMRIICDMGDSLVYSILPGGISGQPLSPHYANQMQLWLNGGFIAIPASRQPAPSFGDRLLLIPQPE